MKFIYKILTLFFICLLPINVFASGIPENVTPVESVNVTTEDTTYENVFVGPDANYIQYHPSKAELNDFATNSRAQNNRTFEQELIKWDDRIPFDTYMVNMCDGSKYIVNTVYNNAQTKKGYGNSQFYVNKHYVSTVTPSPMAICKPLHINALNSNWYLKTANIKSYKIINSHYGRKIMECDITNTKPTEEQTSTVPSDIVDIDNVDQNVSTNNDVTETVSNITGEQINTTTSTGNNSVGNVAATGNGNIINNIIVVISEKFNGFIGNLNINV